MKRPRSLFYLLMSVGVCFLVLTLLWTQVSAWMSYPAGGLAKVLLDVGAKDWLESTSNTPTKLQSRVRFKKRMPDGRISTALPTVEPAHYAYGFPLFLALLLGSRSRHIATRAVIGYCVLLIPGAISMVLVILSQVVKEVPASLLGIGIWQVDAILVSYMFAILVLPTLAPVLLWSWLDRAYLQELIATTRSEIYSQGVEAPRPVFESKTPESGYTRVRTDACHTAIQYWTGPNSTQMYAIKMTLQVDAVRFHGMERIDGHPMVRPRSF